MWFEQRILESTAGGKVATDLTMLPFLCIAEGLGVLMRLVLCLVSPSGYKVVASRDKPYVGQKAAVSSAYNV